MVNETFGLGGDGLALVACVQNQDDGQAEVRGEIGG